MKKSIFLAVFFAFVCLFFGGYSRVFATEVKIVEPKLKTWIPDQVRDDRQDTEDVEIMPVQDLTVPKVKVDRMMALLESQEVTSWYPFNFMKVGIRRAVEVNVSINTVVLLFLFPLVASLVAFSRQVVGLNGFGMIAPLLLATAFLSTGAMMGILVLGFVVVVAIFGKSLIKKVKVPYIPKLAILLWIVSMAVFILMMSSTFTGWSRLLEIGIFPIILFVSVAETFIEAQITRNFASSLTMMVETIILAVVGYKIMSSQLVQSLVLLNPEMMSLFILLLNLLIGRYKGLRLLEVWRFRKLLTK